MSAGPDVTTTDKIVATPAYVGNKVWATHAVGVLMEATSAYVGSERAGGATSAVSIVMATNFCFTIIRRLNAAGGVKTAVYCCSLRSQSYS